MHAKNKQVIFSGKLSEVEKADKCFVRCHRSFVVNVENILEIDKEKMEVQMKNGARCLVSVRMYKGLVRAFLGKGR